MDRAHQAPNKVSPVMPNLAASQLAIALDENLSWETMIYIVNFT
jgi:hypothetical protein